MKCVVCKIGETKAGFGSLTMSHSDSTYIFRHVPADICINCGEEYYDSSVLKAVEENVRECEENGITMQIREFRPELLQSSTTK